MNLSRKFLRHLIRESINEALTDYQPFKGIRNLFQGEEGDKKILKDHLDQFTQMYEIILNKYFSKLGSVLSKEININEHEKLSSDDIWALFVRKFSDRAIQPDLEKLNSYMFDTMMRIPKKINAYTPIRGIVYGAMDDDRDYNAFHDPKRDSTSPANGKQMYRMFRKVLIYTSRKVYNSGPDTVAYIDSILQEDYFEDIIDKRLDSVKTRVDLAYRMTDRYAMSIRREQEKRDKMQRDIDKDFSDAQIRREQQERNKKEHENRLAYQEYIKNIDPEKDPLASEIIGYQGAKYDRNDSSFVPPHPEVWRGYSG